MAFLTGGANSAAAVSTYDVDNSCCFNDGDSAKMSKTLGTATLNTKFTVNVWLKLGNGTFPETNNKVIATARTGTSGPYLNFNLQGSDNAHQLSIYGNDKDGANEFELRTTRKFRDPHAWYCLTVAMDTTLGTAGDRLRIYVNGVEETGFAVETAPTQNKIYVMNYTGYTFVVGARTDDSEYWDGYMAEFCFIDGQQLTPTSFGEFDSDSPTIFKPIDVSGLTFGNNGFYLDFKSSGNLGNDANGGTDLTEANLAATDQSISTPTNIFPTFTPLVKSSYVDIAEGNRLLTGNTASDGGTALTNMPSLTKGKWYIESKSIDDTGQMPQGGFHFNMATTTMYNVNGAAGFSSTGGFGWNSSGGVESTLFTDLSGLTSGSDGDVKQYAWDMDNGAFYIGINNTWQNSGNPESGASKTGSVFSFTPADYPNIGFSSSGFNGSDEGINFGDPHYANTSDAADADGYGKFEFAPPSGYFSICTKNIAEYG